MTTTKRAQKKEQIIYAAIKMLESNSYNDVRIEDIAKQLDIVKSNIFYYFPSKGALYLQVLAKLYGDLNERFILEANQLNLKSAGNLKKLVMKLTDIYIRDFQSLIKLSLESTRIRSECSREEILQYSKVINEMEDRLESIILEKLPWLTRNEVFYIFEVQGHFLRGYYQTMVLNSQYASAADGDESLERLSLYEFRVMRMMRYFFDGLLHEKEQNLLDK